MKDFKDLDVFIQSRLLVKEVYKVTSIFPKEEVYSLTNQIRRSSVSILSNIAEGMGRQ
ncbi:MAG: four helix bundle protein, partial [Opitutaceae bacterium]|nr:four helix bundle protein [Cytophagales bacterium]